MTVNRYPFNGVKRVVSQDDLLVNVGLGAALGGTLLQPLGKVCLVDCVPFPVHVPNAVDLFALGLKVKAMLSSFVSMLNQRCALDTLTPFARLGFSIWRLTFAAELIVNAVDILKPRLNVNVSDLEHVAVERVASLTHGGNGARYDVRESIALVIT